jgi:hypothetical protein
VIFDRIFALAIKLCKPMKIAFGRFQKSPKAVKRRSFGDLCSHGFGALCFGIIYSDL